VRSTERKQEQQEPRTERTQALTQVHRQENPQGLVLVQDQTPSRDQERNTELGQRQSREQELGKERGQQGLSMERTLELVPQEGSMAWALLAVCRVLVQQEGSKVWALQEVCRVPMSEGRYPLEESTGRSEGRVPWESSMASMLELSLDCKFKSRATVRSQCLMYLEFRLLRNSDYLIHLSKLHLN